MFNIFFQDAILQECYPIMNPKNLTAKKWEELYPYFWAVVAVILSLILIPFEKMQHMNVLINYSINASAILFGFLITAQSILLQTNNPKLEELKTKESFSRLIRYNKRAVYNAGIACTYCLANTIVFNLFGMDKTEWYRANIIWLFLSWIGIMTVLICSAYRYISLFFFIILNFK